MVKIGNLRTDSEKQEEGVWREYPRGGEFRIARAGNAKAEAYKRQLLRAWRGRRKGIPDEVAEEIGQKVAAKHILLGWRGLEDENGNLWEHTPERSLQIMQDPEWQDVALWVLVEADTAENYERQAREEEAGN